MEPLYWMTNDEGAKKPVYHQEFYEALLAAGYRKVEEAKRGRKAKEEAVEAEESAE